MSILKSDRWVFITVTGKMGEGKSCFMTILAAEISKQMGKPFSYKENITYSRKEIGIFIDGEGEEKKGQAPEGSTIVADEIISMFFKRNWHDTEQSAGIELLNKCRDRHLCLMGAVPNFWDLDKALYSVITFRVHIYKRGIAWVYEPDENPHTDDIWHRRINEKSFSKRKNPFRDKGYVGTINFRDWTKEEKEEYLKIRNTKRVGTEAQSEKKERYSHLKRQRDELIRAIDKYARKTITGKMISELTGLNPQTITYIKGGQR